MASGSLIPMMCLISSRADLTLESQCVMSSALADDEIDIQFIVLFSTFAILVVFSRYPSSASCVVTATACSDGVVFLEILLGTFCSVMLVCSSLTSRGSLFVVILLLLSDPDEHGCLARFSSALLHRNIATNVILAACSSRNLGWSSLLPSRRQRLCSGRCLLIILRRRLECVVASSALSPAQVSHESPLNRASILLRHASLLGCCRPWPVLKYQHPGQHSLRPQCW